MLSFIKDVSWQLFINPIDFVFLGLTLNLTNINEVNSSFKKEKVDGSRRENITWWSVIFIIFLALILAALYLDSFMENDVLNDKTLKFTSILFCIISLVYSLHIVKSFNSKK